MLRPGTSAVYPVTLNGSFSIPSLEESTSATGGYLWADHRLPPATASCWLLLLPYLGLSLYHADFPELILDHKTLPESFCFVLFSGMYHLLNFWALHHKKPQCQSKSGCQGFLSFKWKPQRQTNNAGFDSSELEQVKICSLLKSKIKWNLQPFYMRTNPSPSIDWNHYNSQILFVIYLANSHFYFIDTICFHYKTVNSEKHGVHLSLSYTPSNTELMM